MFHHRRIPETDILGRKLKIGDKVTVFNRNSIVYKNCTIVEKRYYFDPNDHEDYEMRRAVQIDEGMWFFGLGNHEIIKE